MDELLAVVRREFGHERFLSDIQREACTKACKTNQDMFISLPTNSGKSLIYQLPTLYQNRGLTLVISPSISGIHNQIADTRRLGIHCATINSFTSKSLRRKLEQDLRSESISLRLLYVTPEMLCSDRFKSRFLPHFDVLCRKNQLRLIAFDEAHFCLNTFRCKYLESRYLRARYPRVPIIALTSIATLVEHEKIIQSLGLNQPIKYQDSYFRENLFYDVKCADDTSLLESLSEFVQDQLNLGTGALFEGVGIVYCWAKQTCDDTAAYLTRMGIKARAYHSGLSPKERTEVENLWMEENILIICATISFGMGIDKPNVRLVVHLDMPRTLGDYYLESGRAGRDGKRSYCRLYFKITEQYRRSMELHRDYNVSPSEINSQTAVEQFKSMVNYCNSNDCRHFILSDQTGLGQTIDLLMDNCETSCDNCLRRTAEEQHPARDLYQVPVVGDNTRPSLTDMCSLS